MRITFLGQAGLLFETGELKIMVDPYFSDSVKKVNPKNARRQPIDTRFLEIEPDILIFTHCHLDHFDPETAAHYFNQAKPMTVLCPTNTWVEARKYGGPHNFVEFNRHTEWTQSGIRFSAVKAEHSDRTAIGVVMQAGGKNHYITGDTLYNSEIFSDIPKEIEVLFLPINGEGNNMNMTDAARFAQKVGAKHTVPLHFGMFDDLSPEEFSAPGKTVLGLYETIKI